MKMTVYILKCADGSFYTGLTRGDPEGRVWEHNNLPDANSYTYLRRPVTMVFYEVYDRIVDAIQREQQIKKWSRKKKLALIAEDYSALENLSRRKHLIKD
jgi:putative endonuclease